MTLLLNAYVFGVVTALMKAIAPIALSAMTLWVIVFGWAVLRNEVPETVPTFLWKVFKIGQREGGGYGATPATATYATLGELRAAAKKP